MRNKVQTAETVNEVRIQQAVWDVIYLTACALHEECPDKKRITQMDFSEVYRKCKFHGMEAIVYMALEQAGTLAAVGQPLAGEWKEAKEKAVRKNILLDAGRTQILAEMEQMGIWYMPLKGSILQLLYPKYGMRQMTDNDILYDAGRRDDMIALMKRCGYVQKKNWYEHDDDFVKPPVYNFEMHKTLFEEKYNPEYYNYYKNIKDKLQKDDNMQYGYHFTEEDFYIYMTVHAYKHYEHIGCGLRALVDSYVYIWKKSTAMDWEYVEKQTAELGIAEFERQLRQLSLKLFRKPNPCRQADLTAEELAMITFLAGSGTYGTSENYVAKKLQQYQLDEEHLTTSGRLRYLWNRLFPGMEWFRANEPFYAEHKYLIPFFLIYRIIRHLVYCRKWLKRELHILWNVGKEEKNV